MHGANLRPNAIFIGHLSRDDLIMVVQETVLVAEMNQDATVVPLHGWIISVFKGSRTHSDVSVSCVGCQNLLNIRS